MIRKSWYLTLVVGLFFSCGSEMENFSEKIKPADTLITDVDTVVKIISEVTKPDFDSVYFRDNASVLIMEIDHSDHGYKWTSENMAFAENTGQYALLDTGKVNALNVVRFELEKDPGNYLDFRYRIFTMTDSLASVRFSKKIKKELKKAPGLSYAWDRIYFAKNKFYWLNGPCSYSGKNFSKLASIFRNSINELKIDSVKCNCGGGCN